MHGLQDADLGDQTSELTHHSEIKYQLQDATSILTLHSVLIYLLPGGILQTMVGSDIIPTWQWSLYIHALLQIMT